MEELAREQPGYLGIESARGGVGITVSYWVDAEAARAWKAVAEHRGAQRLGRAQWYRAYRVRIATVEREYGSVAGGSNCSMTGTTAVESTACRLVLLIEGSQCGSTRT